MSGTTTEAAPSVAVIAGHMGPEPGCELTWRETRLSVDFTRTLDGGWSVFLQEDAGQDGSLRRITLRADAARELASALLAAADAEHAGCGPGYDKRLSGAHIWFDSEVNIATAAGEMTETLAAETGHLFASLNRQGEPEAACFERAARYTACRGICPGEDSLVHADCHVHTGH